MRKKTAQDLEISESATAEQKQNHARKHLKHPWEDADLIQDGWKETKEKIDGVRIQPRVTPDSKPYPGYPVSPAFYVG